MATVSSERFKTTIAALDSNTAKLEQLRPVTFHLKTDPKEVLQYGLIAEEVAQQSAEIRNLKQQQKTVSEMQKQLAGIRSTRVAPTRWP